MRAHRPGTTSPAPSPRSRRTPPLASAWAACLLVAGAPAAAESGDPPGKSSTLVVYGDDPCPAPADPEEIVVCARQPESERYRIPEEFRENKEKRGSVAWGTRFDELEEATRFTRPNSCSRVGSWGQTGCFADAIRQWRAERRARNTAP